MVVSSMKHKYTYNIYTFPTTAFTFSSNLHLVPLPYGSYRSPACHPAVGPWSGWNCHQNPRQTGRRIQWHVRQQQPHASGRTRWMFRMWRPTSGCLPGRATVTTYSGQLDPYTDKKSSKSSVDTTLSPFRSPVHVSGIAKLHAPLSMLAAGS